MILHNEWRIPSSVTSRVLNVFYFAVAPSAPVTLQWTLQGPGLVELRWKRPVAQNGVVTSYTAHYLNSGSHEGWLVVSTNGTSYQRFLACVYYVGLTGLDVRLAVKTSGPLCSDCSVTECFSSETMLVLNKWVCL